MIRRAVRTALTLIVPVGAVLVAVLLGAAGGMQASLAWPDLHPVLRLLIGVGVAAAMFGVELGIWVFAEPSPEVPR